VSTVAAPVDHAAALAELQALPAAVQRLPEIQAELKEHERAISAAVKQDFIDTEATVNAYEEARYA
jgi:uncharacterized membrane protein